jgi:formylglycine-generating enzyme required for sulfatase activity
MAGNVWEWCDTVVQLSNRSFRSMMGGYWKTSVPGWISSSSRLFAGSPLAKGPIGFRVASQSNPLALPNFAYVGDAGNEGNNGRGGVNYTYRIGKYTVTNCEYTAFLNAVASNDTNNLYDPRMDITRTGVPGSYSYSSKTNYGSKPVSKVSWFNAARYCNWLHNGRLNGGQDQSTTEQGSYSLPSGTRSSGALYWLPTVNEWYKAAYHKAGSSGYWSYPTQSDTAPSCVQVDSQGTGPIPSQYSC